MSEKKIQAIVYTSNTGHTEEYAHMLGEKLALPVYALDWAQKALPKGSGILYLGWLMAGQVKGYKEAKALFDVQCLCGVGMAANGTQTADVRKANAVQEALPVFTLQGGFEMDKLHGIYRLMMGTMKATVGKKLQQKKDPTPEEKDMLELLLHGGSLVSEDKLSEVLEWYQSIK